MKVKLQRFTAMLMAGLLAVSLITIPAPAASAAAGLVPLLSSPQVQAFISAMIPKVAEWFADEILSGDEEFPNTFWCASLKDEANCVCVTLEELYHIRRSLSEEGIETSIVEYPAMGGFVIQCDSNTFRRDDGSFYFYSGPGIEGWYLTTTAGDMIVGLAVAGDESDSSEPVVTDQWVIADNAAKSSKVVVVSYQTLSDMVAEINASGTYAFIHHRRISGIEYYYISSEDYCDMYCNADGYPYVASYESSATDVKYDYIVNNNGDTIDNSQVIDMTNGTVNFIDELGKTEFSIDDLIYDFSTNTYTADTYNISYDTTTNNYVTNNYTWNITYNITNTYVTNIGQSAEYEPMELYYELPDGRSSADLTADEVAGMSFQFHDVVNYSKSATDAYIRALYHFDGDVMDSSYFSTQGKFEWTQGASISYMDSGTFDGALYLGPEAHSFDITLPTHFGPEDFTVQFRYYQAGEADTEDNIENSLSIGGTTVMKWDDQSIYDSKDTLLTSLAVGSWQELAVMKHNDVLYLYHNGICIYSAANTSALAGTVTLTLGDTTRAYSMLDELRVLNLALAEDGSAYTCTSVPYDTNLVLVLPDSAYPIADEYWEFTSSKENYFPYTYEDFGSGIVSSYFTRRTSTTSYEHYAPDFRYGYSSTYGGTVLYPEFGYLRIANEIKESYVGSYDDSFWGYFPYAFSSIVHVCDDTSNATPSTDYTYLLPGVGDYCFSIVLSDGTVCSLPFTISSGTSLTQSAEFDWGSLVYQRNPGYSDEEYDNDNVYHMVAVIPNYQSYVDIVYMELVEGSSTDLTAEFVTCMYSSEDVQPNTAAIQTDIPVAGYTVGGVRPTFPARGDVWFPVTGNRISACYIYTGYMWESCNARYYTGTRWIPIYAFDIETLQDCWDIADADNVVVQIGSESDFWNWWKEAWIDFRNWLSDSGAGGGIGSIFSSASDGAKTSLKDALTSLIDGILESITEVLKKLIGAAGDLLLGLFDLVTNSVLGGVKDFFSTLTNGSFLDSFQQTDENGNTTTKLPEGIAGVLSFFSALFMLMPAELRTIMIFGIAVLLALAVFKMIKA